MPNGCAACGEYKGTHYGFWDPELGWHTWIAPRNEIRLARMKARREERSS